jgi:monoamine oxidase
MAAPTYDTLILGAGLAALTAARSLTHHRIAILEARDRVGGRAYTSTDTPRPVDLGCSMIHGFREGNPAAKLITEELGMVRYPCLLP